MQGTIMADDLSPTAVLGGTMSFQAANDRLAAMERRIRDANSVDALQQLMPDLDAAVAAFNTELRSDRLAEDAAKRAYEGLAQRGNQSRSQADAAALKFNATSQ